MKVLQTLGAHAGTQPGIFQYRRTPDGVNIDASVGQANIPNNNITLTTAEWSQILQAIRDTELQTFRLTGVQPYDQPPRQSLYELISTIVPIPSGGWTWNDSLKSCVCAVLEHEGSIDLYHGTLGPSHQAIICLKKDVQ